jgi:hypothetical protein
MQTYDEPSGGDPWAHLGPDSHLLSLVCEMFAAQAAAELPKGGADATGAYLALAHAIAPVQPVTREGRLAKVRVAWAAHDRGGLHRGDVPRRRGVRDVTQHRQGAGQ